MCFLGITIFQNLFSFFDYPYFFCRLCLKFVNQVLIAKQWEPNPPSNHQTIVFLTQKRSLFRVSLQRNFSECNETKTFQIYRKRTYAEINVKEQYLFSIL